MGTMKLVKLALQQVINDIDAGNSNASEEELNELLEVINKVTNTKSRLSKYQACKYLNVSRATFDNYVRDGKLPKGKKQQGFKELSWELKDLQNFKNKENDSNTNSDNSGSDRSSLPWEI